MDEAGEVVSEREGVGDPHGANGYMMLLQWLVI